ncbi:hypothetical protein AAGS40_21250 [Paraburkholderia sp. PREW-6R]|uniref:hypothetical protein n=1 Tax=Paraburkholderia sp. PREW-6R TaxID=3141544 RepID=UPI0031F5014B
MKVLKIALLGCALSAAIAAPVAYAQSAPSATSDNQVAQANTASSNNVARQGRAANASANKTEECVGPVSFCNIYFGS